MEAKAELVGEKVFFTTVEAPNLHSNFSPQHTLVRINPNYNFQPNILLQALEFYNNDHFWYCVVTVPKKLWS